MKDDNKDTNLNDLNLKLILKDDSLENSKHSLSKEIFKINDLLKKRYIQDKNKGYITVDKEEKNFLDIKKSANQLNDNIKEQTLQITKSIENHKTELKKLYKEDILFDQNKVQSDVINNQQKLIDNYKHNYDQLKLDFINQEKILNENVQSNRKFLINNDELKNTISRYINHNKNLQNEINRLKKDFNEASLAASKKDELLEQIKFYQEENVRLSSEIINLKKDFEVIKDNFFKVENEKNNIYKKIKELNNSLTKNNIVGTPFVKEVVVEDSINAKVLNDITETNLKKEKENNDKNSELDDQISDIFK